MRAMFTQAVMLTFGRRCVLGAEFIEGHIRVCISLLLQLDFPVLSSCILHRAYLHPLSFKLESSSFGSETTQVISSTSWSCL